MSTDLLDKQELLALARLDFEKERFDQALIRLKQAAALPGDDLPEIFALLGVTYARLRLWSKAQASLTGFLKLQPNALNERFQLGKIYFDSGDSAQALEVWQQVLAREKMHPPALYHSALAHVRLGRPARAIECCDIVLSSAAPDNLFFGRAKELVEQLRKGPSREPSVEASGTSGAPRKRH